mmetsp:Transcript_106068/g.342140  ORF Transcript_106068/g.342140 Transcript_106068/m.342140 type:complete len:217 (-) Transcript_106068:43-693(-)
MPRDAECFERAPIQGEEEQRYAEEQVEAHRVQSEADRRPLQPGAPSQVMRKAQQEQRQRQEPDGPRQQTATCCQMLPQLPDFGRRVAPAAEPIGRDGAALAHAAKWIHAARYAARAHAEPRPYRAVARHGPVLQRKSLPALDLSCCPVQHAAAGYLRGGERAEGKKQASAHRGPHHQVRHCALPSTAACWHPQRSGQCARKCRPCLLGPWGLPSHN